MEGYNRKFGSLEQEIKHYLDPELKGKAIQNKNKVKIINNNLLIDDL
jgi:hypothetical protein